MALTFARLKLRLVRNGFRSPQYSVLFVMGAIVAGALALAGFAFLAGLRHDRVGPDATIVTFSAITVVWIVVPVLGFGTDETLDPQRLSLLPLTRSTLIGGLLVAALLGVAPVATTFALSGALIGMVHGAVGALVILLAIAATILLCVVGSRALIAVLAPLLRSRRGRDMLMMSVMLAVFVPQSFRLFNANGNDDARRVMHQIASRVRYTPFGWAGEAVAQASRGNNGRAVLALAGVFALVAALLVAWGALLPRAMTTADTTGSAPLDQRKRAALFGGAFSILPRTRVGAIAAKELRYFVRDPRRRAPLAASLILPALVLFQSLTDARNRPPGSTLLALVALLPASGLTLNQFGLDGAALWSTIAAGADPKSDMTGKNLATVFVVAPLVTVPALVTAFVAHGWAYLPLTLGLAPGMLGVVLAVGNNVSVRAPYALPDRHNPLSSNPGQGCVAGIAAMGALFVDSIILIPVGVATVVFASVWSLGPATIVSVAFATAYGYGAWRLGRRLASGYIAPRMPELLDAVSPRHAG